MPGLVPGIHVVLSAPAHVDGRDKPGHDDVERASREPMMFDRGKDRMTNDVAAYSTVTDLARLRGWSTSAPFWTAT